MEGNTSSRSLDKVSESSPSRRSDITWNTIPAEVLENVLTPLYCPFKPKDMAPLREVCTHWRDVIDGNFHFRLTVNDKKMDVTQLSHLRLSPSVVVSSLVTELDPEVSIFKDPSAITELKIWGDITPRNFQQLMMDAVNLKQLSFSEKALYTKNLIKPLPIMETEYQEEWKRLTSLTMTIPMGENLFQILSTEMPNLAILKILLKMRDLGSFPRQLEDEHCMNSMFTFLNRSQSLTVLQLSDKSAYSDMRNATLPVYTGDKQFETMRISVSPLIWHSWLPLVKAQRSLKRLKVVVCFPEGHTYIPNPADTYLITALEATLHLNRTNLTCIQLNNLNLSENLNAGVFAEMSNLRLLELKRYQKEFSGGFSLIYNLGMLPNSIEVLNLRGFTSDPAELLQMADLLEKIKHVDLVNILNARNGDPAVSYRVLESFARKENIRAMLIFPFAFSIVLENPHERVNGKYFLLINGYRIEALVGRGERYVKFNFGK